MLCNKNDVVARTLCEWMKFPLTRVTGGHLLAASRKRREQKRKRSQSSFSLRGRVESSKAKVWMWTRGALSGAADKRVHFLTVCFCFFQALISQRLYFTLFYFTLLAYLTGPHEDSEPSCFVRFLVPLAV